MARVGVGSLEPGGRLRVWGTVPPQGGKGASVLRNPLCSCSPCGLGLGFICNKSLSSPSHQAESYKKKVSSKEEISLSTMELSGIVVKQGYLSKQVWLPLSQRKC